MNIWYTITFLGTPEFWVSITLFLAGLYFFMKGYGTRKDRLKNFLVLMIPSIIAVLIVIQIMKFGFAIPRPCISCDAISSSICNPYCTTNFSFPSGHTAIVFGMITAGFIVSKKYRKQMILGFIIPLIVALSRYMLGVHTIIDLVGGAAVGIAMPWIFMMAYKKYKLFKFK